RGPLRGRRRAPSALRSRTHGRGERLPDRRVGRGRRPGAARGLRPPAPRLGSRPKTSSWVGKRGCAPGEHATVMPRPAKPARQNEPDTSTTRSPQAKTGTARVGLPRWLRQPRHDGRAGYRRHMLASVSRPKKALVALLAREGVLQAPEPLEPRDAVVQHA